MWRKDGYYWVKLHGAFIVAKYYNFDLSPYDIFSYWNIPGSIFQYSDSDFEEIFDNKLIPPKIY